MHKPSHSVGFLVALALIGTGCEEPFTPKGEFREELVVYSVLSNLTDMHYARVYHTYDPPAFDPFEHTIDDPVEDAIVQILEGGNLWAFRDTVVVRKDTSRYQTPIKAYVCSPLNLERGKAYTLAIQPPLGTQVYATTSVPATGYIYIYSDKSSVTYPRSATIRTIQVQITIPTATRGYLVRFILAYEILQNGIWIHQEIEIPSQINNLGTPDETFVYPQLTRSDGLGTATLTTHFVNFRVDGYAQIVGRLYSNYGSAVRFKQAIFTVTQVERNLYNYYNIVRGFRDPNSIRVDEPDFSNLSGAVGVFGAFAVDSVVVSLPSTL